MSGKEIVLEITHCPRCSSDQFQHLYTTPDFLYGVRGTFSVVQCKNCGLQYQNPRPTAESLSSIYPDVYAPHQSRKLGRSKGKLGRLLESINPLRAHHQSIGLNPVFVEDGQLIELGCASGGRLVNLRMVGWKHLYGIELSSKAAALAKANGFDVRCGLIENELGRFPDQYFDVVISSMVLEHLYDPFALIDLVARKLKPGGQFLFSTIVRDSLDARLYSKYWAGYDLPRHMVFYTLDDLTEYLSNGFSNIRSKRQTAFGDFSRSSEWRRAAGEKYLLDSLIGLFKPGILTELLGMLAAPFGGSSRVSLEGRRKMSSEKKVPNPG